MSNLLGKTQRFTPNNGDTIVMQNSDADLDIILAPAADIASLTIVWLTAPLSSQKISIQSTANIAALTHVGATLNQSFPSIKAGGSYSCIYDIAATTFMADMINILPGQSVTFPTTRALNTAFQVSQNQNALVAYSVEMQTSLSLSGGQSARVYLKQSDDQAFTQNVKVVSRGANGNTGALTLGLALNQLAAAVLAGVAAAGKWLQIVTENVTGAPTFSLVAEQEVLI